MLDWFSLHVDEREFLLGDPWEFASWLDATQLARNRMLRHAIVFLFFPDEFEPIVSNRGKREIVSQLHQGDRVNPSDAVAVDRALLKIRQRLEQRYPGDEYHFYASPFKELWQGTSASCRATVRTAKKSHARRSLIRIRPAKPPPTSPPTPTRTSSSPPPTSTASSPLSSPARTSSSRARLGPARPSSRAGSPGASSATRTTTPSRWSSSTSPTPTRTSSRASDPPRPAASPSSPASSADSATARAPTPPSAHVFIIDEINRGNLSRIFGELLMLIEHDKRSEDYAVALTYSEERFHVPTTSTSSA